MTDATKYLLLVLSICLVLVVILLNVVYPLFNPSTSQTITFTVNNTYNATTYEITRVTGVQNNTATLPSNRYSWSHTAGVKMLTNASWQLGAYTVFYDYQRDPTILGMNYGWIVILLMVALFVALMRFLTKK